MSKQNVKSKNDLHFILREKIVVETNCKKKYAWGLITTYLEATNTAYLKRVHSTISSVPLVEWFLTSGE